MFGTNVADTFRKHITMLTLKHIFLTTGLILTLSLVAHAQFVTDRAIKEGEESLEFQVMNISVFDAATKQPLPSDIRVKGLNPRKAIEFENVTDTVIEIRNYRMYSVSCIKPGYMYYAEKFWPDEAMIHTQPVAMRPLELGLKTDIRDVVFLGDKTQIYHKSKPALDELIEFLQINKNVQIAIIGHVNGPDNNRAQRIYHKASVERARSVRDYLVENGIDPKRLEVKGAGNTEMIYPDPITDWQNEANRRIEIEVIGL